MKKSKINKHKKMKSELLDIEDRVGKVCIAYGEKRIPKEEFENAIYQLNSASIKILKQNNLLTV